MDLWVINLLYWEVLFIVIRALDTYCNIIYMGLLLNKSIQNLQVVQNMAVQVIMKRLGNIKNSVIAIFRELQVKYVYCDFFLLGYNMANNHPDPHRCMSKLNEHCQKKGLKLEYKNIAITGPSHDRV